MERTDVIVEPEKERRLRSRRESTEEDAMADLLE